MGSIGLGEIITICVVILIIFGPRRLPELARVAGQLLAKARQATSAIQDEIQRELGDAAEPIRQVQEDFKATGRELKDTMSSIAELPNPDEASPPAATSEEPEEDKPPST